MSIKIFHTPFSYKGSTENLFQIAIDKIKSPDYSQILYIAPTPRKLRDSQLIFHRIAGGFYIPPEMLTLKQLSKRIYYIHEYKKVIPQYLIPIILSRLTAKGIGFASIITNFINEIKQYHTGKSIETIRGELKAIFYELGIHEEVSARIMEALHIFNAYQELLNKYSAADENDVMTACPDLIKMQGYRYSTLILDGFYELTKTEEIIIKALIENVQDVLISIPYNINLSYISAGYIYFLNNNFKYEPIYLTSQKDSIEPVYHPYTGLEEEIEGIARDIKNHFIAGKVKDLDKIIITFPDLWKYTDRVSRIFKKYGIPHTLSTSKPLGKNKPFLDLLALLESVSDDYSRLPFCQFLASSYFKNIPSVLKESIPNICLISGVIKGKDAWLNLSGTIVSKQSKDKRSLYEIEKELRWVFKRLSPLESIKNEGSYRQYSECIMKLLNDLEFADVRNIGIESNRQDIDLKDKIFEILKELSFIDTISAHAPGNPSLTLRQFIDALKHILNITDIEIENTGVQIMGILETQGIEPEYLYFGGLKDGDWPSKPDIDHILPDSVRTRFGLVNLDTYLKLQRFIFYRALESTNNYHLSYHVMEGDRFFLPSPFLPWNREVKQKVYGIFSREEELLRKGKIPLTSCISEIEGIAENLVKNRFGEESFIRVTDIDSYRTCPRKFFIEKILNLEPLEIKKYEVEAALLGIISHEIMQLLISKPFVYLDELAVRAEEILDKLLSHRSIEEFWKKAIKDAFLSILPDIYKIELKIMDEGYSFMKAEALIEGEIIKGIKLRGKIDRIDKKVTSEELKVKSKEKNSSLITHHPSLSNDIIEIIDYKTGSTQFSGPQVITKGATLQLFLYASLMKAMGAQVERVGIYSLKDMHISWIPGRNDRKDGRTIDDYIRKSHCFLEETVLKMRSGNFSANPLNEQTCRNCPERPYCPYIQKTIISYHDK